jgi:hypothetical protein
VAIAPFPLIPGTSATIVKLPEGGTGGIAVSVALILRVKSAGSVVLLPTVSPINSKDAFSAPPDLIDTLVPLGMLFPLMSSNK